MGHSDLMSPGFKASIGVTLTECSPRQLDLNFHTATPSLAEKHRPSAAFCSLWGMSIKSKAEVRKGDMTCTPTVFGRPQKGTAC